MTRPPEPTPGMVEPASMPRRPGPSPVYDDDLLPAKTARPLKAVGFAGYTLLLVAIALLGFTIVAAGAGWTLAPWITATAVCAVLAVGCLAGARLVLAARPAHDRAQHDPLVPEVTEEEAQAYERHHPHSGSAG